MQQVWITRFGGPQVLEVREAPEPEPAAGEIRISVQAAGVNFADVSARAGLYPDAPTPPMVVGYEVAGAIDRIGPGVEDFSLGDRVLALTRFGGYSSSVVVPAFQAARVPEGKDLRQAACLPVTYLAASLMLERLCALRPDDWVLIHAAAGGVGLAALQLAKHIGATTVGTARAAKHARLTELGLDHPIDYQFRDFEAEVTRISAGRGVDVVLDPIGGTTTRKNYRCLAPLGRMVIFGLSSANAPSRREAWWSMPKALATTPVFHPLQLMNANRSVAGFNLGHLWDERQLLGAALSRLTELWRTGVIDPVVDSVFPFEHTADAHTRLEQGSNFGKVVLVPSS